MKIKIRKGMGFSFGAGIFCTIALIVDLVTGSWALALLQFFLAAINFGLSIKITKNKPVEEKEDAFKIQEQ